MVSIIITAYNSQDYIEECLDSIEKQTFFFNNQNFEVLLGIDNCEKTLQKVLSIKDRFRNLRVFMMNSNEGTYVTTNTLIDLCSFDYIIRFDSDDVMCNNMVKTLMKYKHYDIVRFLYYKVTDTIIDSRQMRYPHGVAMFKKSVFDACGGYRDWRCAADTELLSRVENHFNICKLPERLFYRRIHTGSLTSDADYGYLTPNRLAYQDLIRVYSAEENIHIPKIVNSYVEY